MLSGVVPATSRGGPVQTQMMADPAEPCGKFRAAVEAAELLVVAQKSVLCSSVGVVNASQSSETSLPGHFLMFDFTSAA